MAKSTARKGSQENPITEDDLKKLGKKAAGKEEITYEITQAKLKDDFCNFSYKITGGIGFGSEHNVKDMPGIIKDELRNAFVKLNVHLAVVDEVYKNSGIEIDDIDKYHGEDLTTLYVVSGFRIKGGKSNETIVLIGNKFVSTVAGRIELETPAISMDNLSNYKWYNELKTASDEVRRQVSLYKEGNYIAVKEPEEEKTEEEQPNLFSGEQKAAAAAGDTSITEDDFQKGKVQ